MSEKSQYLLSFILIKGSVRTWIVVFFLTRTNRQYNAIIKPICRYVNDDTCKTRSLGHLDSKRQQYTGTFVTLSVTTCSPTLTCDLPEHWELYFSTCISLKGKNVLDFNSTTSVTNTVCSYCVCVHFKISSSIQLNSFQICLYSSVHNNSYIILCLIL